jgi:hypothetical protein
MPNLPITPVPAELAMCFTARQLYGKPPRAARGHRVDELDTGGNRSAGSTSAYTFSSSLSSFRKRQSAPSARIDEARFVMVQIGERRRILFSSTTTHVPMRCGRGQGATMRLRLDRTGAAERPTLQQLRA